MRCGEITLVLAILGAVAFNLFTLRRFPPVFPDEAWMASRAWGWLHTGLNYGALDAGVWERFDGYWTVLPLLPTLVNAAFIRLFGLSVIAMRSASLLAGLGLLAAVFGLANEVFQSRHTGLIAVLLVCTSFPFLYSAHLIRPDMYVAMFGYGAILSYLIGWRRKRPLFSLVAGLLIGLAIEFHPNGVIFMPVILALHLMDDRRQFFRKRRFLAFLGGVGIGLAGYAWLHILRYPQTYLALMGRKMRITHMPPLVSRNPATVLQSLTSMSRFLFVGTGGRILATVTIVGLILIFRRTPAYARAVIMFSVAALTFALAVRNRAGHYAILLAPFSDILLAAWLHEPAKVSDDREHRWLMRGKAVALSAIIVSIVLTFELAVILTPPPGDMERVAQRIERVLPPNGTIIGSQTYWFDLHEHSYFSWQQIFRYEWFDPHSTFEDAMKALRPDVLVMDVHWRSFVASGPQQRPRPGQPLAAWDRGISKKEIEAFLAQYATHEDHFNTRAYGQVDVYVIHWDRLLEVQTSAKDLSAKNLSAHEER